MSPINYTIDSMGRFYVIYIYILYPRFVNVRFYYLAEEAISKHGAENVQIYQTSFTGLFHAMTEHKTNTTMKLICLGKEEKAGAIISYF